MSETPRTDNAAIGFARIMVDHEKQTTTELVEANFARQLERELAAALSQIESAKSALGEHPDTEIDLAQRISDIRDEGRAHFHAYTNALKAKEEAERTADITMTGFGKLEEKFREQVLRAEEAERNALARAAQMKLKLEKAVSHEFFHDGLTGDLLDVRDKAEAYALGYHDCAQELIVNLAHAAIDEKKKP